MTPKTDLAPSGQPWALGVRTCDKDGKAYGGFQWKIEAGDRNEAPDWRPTKVCGNGLHLNPEGLGDWSLLSEAHDALWMICRYDPALAIDLDGKVKVPWCEVIMTSRTASRALIMSSIAARSRAAIEGLAKENTASAEGGCASATGDRGHASATGDSGHASATGDRGHASATGDSSCAVSCGGGYARASATGAIFLTAWGFRNSRYVMLDAVGGMVGTKLRGVRIKPDTNYRLTATGKVEPAA